MIGSSERGLHVTIAAVLEKNTDVANIRILSPSGLFDCLDFLFTQSEMCAFLLGHVRLPNFLLTKSKLRDRNSQFKRRYRGGS